MVELFDVQLLWMHHLQLQLDELQRHELDLDDQLQPYRLTRPGARRPLTTGKEVNECPS
ncbi:hypothetical protein ACI2K6_09195 [Microbacterium sp. NPDC006705]|uniref:hypothetical protein n=1 Tax=Microbacterium sp. NPDC006705 TaxID=3364181 RepID=UPI00384A8002